MNEFAVRAGAVACVLIGVPSVQAQTNDEASRQLEEVVVTAQKRVENVQDVPLAVSVVSEGHMESAGVREFADMAKVAPSLNIRRWKFRADPDRVGERDGWFKGLQQTRLIPVPCSWNEIFDDLRNYTGRAWYQSGPPKIRISTNSPLRWTMAACAMSITSRSAFVKSRSQATSCC